MSAAKECQTALTICCGYVFRTHWLLEAQFIKLIRLVYSSARVHCFFYYDSNHCWITYLKPLLTVFEVLLKV